MVVVSQVHLIKKKKNLKKNFGNFFQSFSKKIFIIFFKYCTIKSYNTFFFVEIGSAIKEKIQFSHFISITPIKIFFSDIIHILRNLFLHRCVLIYDKNLNHINARITYIYLSCYAF